MKVLNVIIGIVFISISLFSCKKPGLVQQAGINGSRKVIHNDSLSSASQVQIVKENGVFKILRDGQPYTIKGAAINTNLDFDYWTNLTSYGGNSIRNYNVTDSTQRILDSAYAHGISVTLCLYAAHEEFGFNYNDTAAVHQQLTDFTYWVKKYRNHPAVLMWAIGNEVNSKYTNLKVWNAVNDIAQMIHLEDPNHPAATIVAGADTTMLSQIKLRAPNLDCLGINSYSPIATVYGKLQSVNFPKPYFIGEYGPTGTWETSAKTSWGSLQEFNSSRKANVYQIRYSSISSNFNNGCLGSYVFMWGHQTHGAVAMWYGLFSRERRKFGSVEMMQNLWTGSFPSNRAPQIPTNNEIIINGQIATDNVTLVAGQNYNGSMTATDPDNDPITFEWTVVKESAQISTNPAIAGTFPGVANTIVQVTGNQVVIKAPAAGKYRLYGFAKDNHNHIASAVVPFQVL
ncbi:glycoside hydrolase family 2 TIM barrel-domain containing protein [Mucilaginibacter sabulilitoris]|uniref:Glycoside hydrolase family 2 TIM barrel-domain containing protein n=1 Tax=Mucilaginibacter sabulilitoris TaxID=1173583 RepID=A0ABZ0TEQ6_9SPHI|nr:glycoside hydrolase family 2 TIM barrel-domain containing protein [Mucilaginibacter sabulilitoris]WPU91239.1 glycoside hydrolase family 2 TIM barrel-domain containing protein [Mucilaginibacter sabulilitoris]